MCEVPGRLRWHESDFPAAYFSEGLARVCEGVTRKATCLLVRPCRTEPPTLEVIAPSRYLVSTSHIRKAGALRVTTPELLVHAVHAAGAAHRGPPWQTPPSRRPQSRVPSL